MEYDCVHQALLNAGKQVPEGQILVMFVIVRTEKGTLRLSTNLTEARLPLKNSCPFGLSGQLRQAPHDSNMPLTGWSFGGRSRFRKIARTVFSNVNGDIDWLVWVRKEKNEENSNDFCVG